MPHTVPGAPPARPQPPAGPRRGLRLAALLLPLLCAVPAAAQQPPPNREATVQNETDLTIRELYLAPPGAAERGPDRLGAEMLAPGGTFRARLGRTRDCLFDVTAVFQDGSEEARRRVDICRAPRVVFGDPAMPTLEARIANTSRVVLRELYAVRSAARAADPAAWGPDRLGAEVIEPGAAFALRLRTRDCVFDLRAVYADDREELRERQDLCASRAASFDRSTIPRPPTRTLVLLNRHLATVQEVYLSPGTEADWGPDRLGAATLAPGAEATVTMEGPCEADLRVVFPNGGAEERRELDICALGRVVLRPGWVVAERPEAEPEPAATPDMPAVPDPGALRLRNAGRVPVVEVYAAPPGAPRGEDRLGADVLRAGETMDIEPPAPNACAADLLVVFRDGREEARRGVDLCAGEEIEVR